ncbi:MAG TPA: ABC transporter ATP-binding protein [Terriglobales bacterium]|jgi:ABC-2 type transport system ATP-binding protein
MAIESTPVAPAIVSVENVVHDYGTRRALNGISFDIREAELFGLLGPNGSGKTTLFRILTTLMLPTSGRALIAGADPVKEPNLVRHAIGIVYQARSVDVKLTVRENVRHQGHLYGLWGASLERRIDEMLERVRLRDREKDLVETLSGGMQRRVEVAKGLLHHPQVLLLDEPTTGLDPGARRDLWQYLAELRDREAITVIVTTHLMEEAEHCDRLAIMSAGTLVALGTPNELRGEIGTDIVELEATADAQALAERISQRFAVDARVLNQKIRFEQEEAHRFIPALMESFPGEVQSVSVSKPSLEDVFIRRTGHRFWNEQNPEEQDGDTNR